MSKVETSSHVSASPGVELGDSLVEGIGGRQIISQLCQHLPFAAFKLTVRHLLYVLPRRGFVERIHCPSGNLLISNNPTSSQFLPEIDKYMESHARAP